MVTLKGKRRAARVGVLSLVGVVALFAAATVASAQIVPDSAASDRPAGYVVLPKVVVHTTGGVPAVPPGGVAYDTIIQITNTNETSLINVNCWWVNANNHCGGTLSGPICNTTSDCPLGLLCLPTWDADDFQIQLTPGQPIGFTASAGIPTLPCDPDAPGPGCPNNAEAHGLIPRVSEDPFRGELKCVQVDDSDNPVAQNDLKIEATIVSSTVPGGAPAAPATTAAAYNGIGFEADETFPPAQNPAFPLCLGNLPNGTPGGVSCNQEYAPCPNVLILNHFFERATPEIGGVVNTELTLVPCSEDLGDPVVSANFEVLAQMLIFNEFEQRFSSSVTVECYRNTTLADIDTQPGPGGDSFSLFAAGVQGTLTGQTRIGGVRGAPGRLGYGLIGVACEQYRSTPGGPILATTAFNLHHDGFNPGGDAVYLDQFPQDPE